jgi:tetratricopeptide (TPR) repeat protein
MVRSFARPLFFLLLLSAVAASVGCKPKPPADPQGADAALVARADAPLFKDMGEYHRSITTRDAGAQRYFDQGMVLAFGFNHAEAIRSFRAAQKLDPQCAMCFWGEGLATGPNINVTSKGKAVMSPADRKAAYAAAQKAVALQSNASEVERALIGALATRYDGSETSDRDPQDRAYAAAMKSVVERFPEDDDAAAIYAEAWMNTMPWDYWAAEGQPKPETVEVLNALEGILARSPRHPLALHLYIHATEASSDPKRAEKAADTLATLVPGSGHLVHMPAHTYWRVGRYHDASEANVQAAAIDEAYIAQCNAQGFYPAMYYPHNIHFLWAAATMEGRSAVALEAARKVAANVRLEQIQQFPTVEYFKTIPLVGLVQFARWQEILAEPAPDAGLDYAAAIRHYARGVAFARTGDLAGARAERTALVPLRDSVKVTFLDTNDLPATTLLTIADELLQGEIALADNSLDAAIRHFRTAVETQDSLPYMEPPFWYYPTRRSLGAALLQAKRFADAEAVYRKDLEGYPHNGWSMSGLAESLEAQGKTAEAAEVRKMFEHVWARADVTLKGSRV